MKARWIIKWINQRTGMCGKGKALFDHEAAVALADELNQEFPEIAHTVQPLEESSVEAEVAMAQ